MEVRSTWTEYMLRASRAASSVVLDRTSSSKSVKSKRYVASPEAAACTISLRVVGFVLKLSLILHHQPPRFAASSSSAKRRFSEFSSSFFLSFSSFFSRSLRSFSSFFSRSFLSFSSFSLSFFSFFSLSLSFSFSFSSSFSDLSFSDLSFLSFFSFFSFLSDLSFSDFSDFSDFSSDSLSLSLSFSDLSFLSFFSFFSFFASFSFSASPPELGELGLPLVEVASLPVTGGEGVADGGLATSMSAAIVALRRFARGAADMTAEKKGKFLLLEEDNHLEFK